MAKYRDHRGDLARSMATVRTVKNRGQLIQYLRESLDRFTDRQFDWTKLKIEKYAGEDKRIGWAETWLVSHPDYGVFGMTDGDLPL